MHAIVNVGTEQRRATEERTLVIGTIGSHAGREAEEGQEDFKRRSEHSIAGQIPVTVAEVHDGGPHDIAARRPERGFFHNAVAVECFGRRQALLIGIERTDALT